MKDYSIEYSIEKINSVKTKKYFKEVSSSYYNGNYRAAVVTLYSVVINDILMKLQTLEEVYEDITARKILQEIKDFQKTNPNSPDWEKDIVEKVKGRTSLIDNVDYAHFQALKNDRHLCAHPVIGKDDNLYTPTKENVASHVRNMLESFFLKPPMLSKKILSTILVDIEDKKDILIDDLNFEKYIKAKYLDNIDQTGEVSIFRDLWKFVFYLDDDRANKNKDINYQLLCLLYKRNLSKCKEKITNEREYFSNIKNDESCLIYLIKFLMQSEFLYIELRDDAKTLIVKLIENNANAKVAAWFLSGTFIEHLKTLKELSISYPGFYAEQRVYYLLFEVGKEKGFKKEIGDFIIWKYTNAISFNDADHIYSDVISSNLEILSKKQLEELCEGANKNSQVYNRNRSVIDHYELHEFIKENHTDFNFENYPKVF